MTQAWLSLLAFAVVLFAGRREGIYLGALSLGAAWLIGSLWLHLPSSEIASAFPTSLFLTLFGVTLLFGLAKTNGTLDSAAHAAVRCVRGRSSMLPLLFFGITLAVAMAGPGNIGAVAILAPFAMAASHEAGLGSFIMVWMLVNGANAGAFSPIAPTGIIASSTSARVGIPMDAWTGMFLPSFFAQSVVALAGYAVWFMWMRPRQASQAGAPSMPKRPPFDREHKITAAAVAVFILGVSVGRADVGFLAIFLSALVLWAGVADGRQTLRHLPWDTMLMVCGVSLLMQMIERVGGLDLFTSGLARVSDPKLVTGILAGSAGLLSVYSSSSGVVLPTFIPMVPGLISKMGGGDAVSLVAAINVGSHLVDISPLSTLGALCLAQVAEKEDKNRLFRKLLMASLLMVLAGGISCYVLFGLF